MKTSSVAEKELLLESTTERLIWTLFTALAFAFASLIMDSIALIYIETNKDIAAPLLGLAFVAAVGFIITGIHAIVLNRRLSRLQG